MFGTLIYYDKDGTVSVMHFNETSDEEIVDYIQRNNVKSDEIKVLEIEEGKNRRVYILQRDFDKFIRDNS